MNRRHARYGDPAVAVGMNDQRIVDKGERSLDPNRASGLCTRNAGRVLVYTIPRT
jgi:hypothetical protein